MMAWICSPVLAGAACLAIACGSVGGGKRRVETVSSTKSDSSNEKSSKKKKKKSKKIISEQTEELNTNSATLEATSPPAATDSTSSVHSQINPIGTTGGMVPINTANPADPQPNISDTGANPFNGQNLDPKTVQAMANGNIDLNQLSQLQMAQLQTYVSQNGGWGGLAQQYASGNIPGAGASQQAVSSGQNVSPNTGVGAVVSPKNNNSIRSLPISNQYDVETGVNEADIDRAY